MLSLDDPRLNAGYRLPDPVHPDSLVAAIEEVAARYPMAVSKPSFNIVAMVAVELGCSWEEIRIIEAESQGILELDLNDYHTPGAPLRITDQALEYWTLLGDLAPMGWTFNAMARSISYLHRNNNTPYPPF